MKRCPYCGKEYPDEATHCILDNYALAGGEPPPVVEVAVLSTSSPPLPPPDSTMPRYTERQMLVFEVVMVCLVAFGSPIFTSTYTFFQWGYGTSSGSTYGWLVMALRQGSSLMLVWYLLLRRGKTFFDLGMELKLKDFGWSCVVYIIKTSAYRLVFFIIILTGLTSSDYRTTNAHASYAAIGGSVSLVMLLIQILNPFYEELIVRAYLMTQVKQLTNSATKAIIISTLLQTSYHFYQGAPAAIAHGGAFLVYSIYYSRTNRIAPVILAHLYTDVGGALWYSYHR